MPWTAGSIFKTARDSLARFTPNRYLLFLAAGSRSNGSQRSRGASGGRPAGDGPRHGGAMVGLAGARENPAAEHSGRSRAHQNAEKLLAHLPTRFAWTGVEHRWPDARRGGAQRRRDPKQEEKTARAWFLRLGWKNEVRWGDRWPL